MTAIEARLGRARGVGPGRNSRVSVVERDTGRTRGAHVDRADAGRPARAALRGYRYTVSREAIETLKQMVVGGKYDHPEVIATVARRMAARGLATIAP